MVSASGSLLLVALLLTVSIVSKAQTSQDTLISSPFPSPHTPNNRILAIILAFDFGHIETLHIILQNYVDICEAGWNPTLVFFTSIEWSQAFMRMMRQKSFCYHTNSFLELRTFVQDPSVKINLASFHRDYIRKELSNFDHFIYQEDDIIINHSHIIAYLYETKRMMEIDLSLLNNYCIGFQRYWSPDTQNQQNNLFQTEYLEELPQFRYICLENLPYLEVHGNIHQGMWMLTKIQVLLLDDKCAFLSENEGGREHMSSFSLFRKCEMIKIIPGLKFTKFTIRHYYKSRHPSWIPVFFADENIRAGHSYDNSDKDVAYPECWIEGVNLAREEQQMYAAPSMT